MMMLLTILRPSEIPDTCWSKTDAQAISWSIPPPVLANTCCSCLLFVEIFVGKSLIFWGNILVTVHLTKCIDVSKLPTFKAENVLMFGSHFQDKCRLASVVD